MPFVSLILFLASTTAPSPLIGNWLTPNQSIVGIYACGQNGMLCAKLEEIGPKNLPRVDAHNPDASQRGRVLCGLQLADDFKLDGTEQATGGHIYDPESGHTYSAQMQVAGDALKLRGYIGLSLFGRTETWHRTTTVPNNVCRSAKG